MFDFAEYYSLKLTLAPGEWIYFFTDGISEALDTEEEEYGEEALGSRLSRSAKKEPDLILKDVEAEIRSWTKTASPASFMHDDFTHMLLKRLP
jgi:phosphoserine phosphatase RsbU/P